MFWGLNLLVWIGLCSVCAGCPVFVGLCLCCFFGCFGFVFACFLEVCVSLGVRGFLLVCIYILCGFWFEGARWLALGMVVLGRAIAVDLI